MVALLPSLSDRDLRQLTPTLEELGLLSVPEIRGRWEKAIAQATDQRGLNIAKNVRDKGAQGEARGGGGQRGEEGRRGGDAPRSTCASCSSSTSRARCRARSRSRRRRSRRSSRGFPLEKLHVAAFDTMGQVLKPKAASRAAVQHMLAPLKADGGTIHGAAVQALHRDGVRVPDGGEADRDRRRRRGRRVRRAARAARSARSATASPRSRS